MVMTLCQIHGTPRTAIGRHHLERCRVLLVGIIVKREKLIGKPLVNQFRVKNTAIDYQALQRDIIIFLKHVDIRPASPAGLMTHVGKSVAGTSRNSHYIREINLMFHKGIQHTGSEHATHASALENKSCIGSDLHFNVFYNAKVLLFHK